MTAHAPRIDLTARGFLFDMDGTLVDSTPIVVAAWTAFGERVGIDPSAILAVSHGRQAFDTMTRFLPDRSEAERRQLAADLVQDEISRTDGITEIVGAAALLRTLLDLGAPVSLVTSAPRELALSRMRIAGVPVPPTIVTAEDVTNGKPAPDCYLLGAERLGLDAADCLAFEDADAGLDAAVAAGAHAVVVGAHESDRTASIPRLTDLTGLSVTAEVDGRFRLHG